MKSAAREPRPLAGFGGLGLPLAATLVVLLTVPFIALGTALGPRDLAWGFKSPLFLPALLVTLKTSFISLAFVALLGTPLAWWLATSPRKSVRWVELCVELPIVLPPAVVGVGLLVAFGRNGLLGPVLLRFGLSIPFTELAVILAQMVVAAPFFVQALANSFRRIDVDVLLVARTLGASPWAAFRSVVVPIALPGILVGSSLAWARALGEFGATLVFAGNLPGTTQTLSLAVFAALESDVRVAIVLSLLLALVGAIVLLGLRGLSFGSRTVSK